MLSRFSPTLPPSLPPSLPFSLHDRLADKRELHFSTYFRQFAGVVSEDTLMDGRNEGGREGGSMSKWHKWLMTIFQPFPPSLPASLLTKFLVFIYVLQDAVSQRR